MNSTTQPPDQRVASAPFGGAIVQSEAWISKTRKGAYSPIYHRTKRCCKAQAAQKMKSKSFEILEVMHKSECGHCWPSTCKRC